MNDIQIAIVSFICGLVLGLGIFMVSVKTLAFDFQDRFYCEPVKLPVIPREKTIEGLLYGE